MAEILKIEDHYAAVVERLPTQFRDRPNIDAVLQVWFNTIQEVEDDLESMRTDTKLLNAKGKQLDRHAARLGITRDFAETDADLYGRIASVIIGRASEGSPDSIRRSVEAVTGLNRTNIIEFSNPSEWEDLSSPLRGGATMVFGYYNDDRMIIDDVKNDLIKDATPIGDGSTIFGKHLNIGDFNSLWIPCEVLLSGDDLVVRDLADNVDNLVDSLGNKFVLQGSNLAAYGKDWELGVLPEDDIFFDELTVAPSGDFLSVVTTPNGTPSPLITGISGLELHGHLLEIDQTNITQ